MFFFWRSSVEKIVNDCSLELSEVFFEFWSPVVSFEAHDKTRPECDEAEKTSNNHVKEVIENPEVVETNVIFNLWDLEELKETVNQQIISTITYHFIKIKNLINYK